MVIEGDALSPNQSSMLTLAFLLTITCVPTVYGWFPILTQSDMGLVIFKCYEFLQRFRTVQNTS